MGGVRAPRAGPGESRAPYGVRRTVPVPCHAMPYSTVPGRKTPCGTVDWWANLFKHVAGTPALPTCHVQYRGCLCASAVHKTVCVHVLCINALQVSDPEVWAWQDIQALEIEAIADNPCFLFLWCGAEEGLEAGRICMQVRGMGGEGQVFCHPCNRKVLAHVCACRCAQVDKGRVAVSWGVGLRVCCITRRSFGLPLGPALLVAVTGVCGVGGGPTCTPWCTVCRCPRLHSRTRNRAGTLPKHTKLGYRRCKKPAVCQTKATAMCQAAHPC